MSRPIKLTKEIEPMEISPERMASYWNTEYVVRGYQANEEGKSEELIRLFEGYLVRYYQILAHGNVDYHDFRSRLFITMFIKSAFAKKFIHSNTADARG